MIAEQSGTSEGSQDPDVPTPEEVVAASYISQPSAYARTVGDPNTIAPQQNAFKQKPEFNQDGSFGGKLSIDLPGMKIRNPA
jgi:hypothetical protein